MRPAQTELREQVMRIVSEVLVVPPDAVRLDTPLVAELGAESIDFLDLIFRLEEWLGVRIPVEKWDAYLKSRPQPHNASTDITPNLVVAFAAEVLDCA